ncbi:MAG TPA: hypothetical protein VME66_13680 [Candidatus Acidoferrales bacterium]|nr:hypothetical protein [Candidatus Acidoferrales bacterium]
MNQGYGLLAFCLLVLAACSTGGGSASNNNPLAGVTIIQPTAPPSATPTPVPTPTPTPAPNMIEALTDTGFESGGFSDGWTACSIPHVAPSSTASPFATVAPASIGAVIVSATSSPFQVAATPNPATTPAVYAGTYSALTFSGTGAQTTYATTGKLGPAGANGVCQTFTVPTDAVLTMYVNEGGSDSGLNYADQQADIISTGGVDTNLFFELDAASYSGTGTPPAGGAWAIRGPYDLTSAPYNLTPGQSATLFIGSFDSDPAAKYGVYMFVDNVTITGFSTSSSSLHRK